MSYCSKRKIKYAALALCLTTNELHFIDLPTAGCLYNYAAVINFVQVLHYNIQAVTTDTYTCAIILKVTLISPAGYLFCLHLPACYLLTS